MNAETRGTAAKGNKENGITDFPGIMNLHWHNRTSAVGRDVPVSWFDLYHRVISISMPKNFS